MCTQSLPGSLSPPKRACGPGRGYTVALLADYIMLYNAHPNFCGLQVTLHYSGPNLAYSSNKSKSPDIPICHSNHLILVLMWCTSIWLACFLSHNATNTCSPVWIDSHAGLRHSQSKTSLQKLLHEHSCLDGWHGS